MASRLRRTRRDPSTTDLDRRIAVSLANPKPGNAEWEREYADLLVEKHSKARMPTVDELARALQYIEGEYVIKNGRVNMEQWAEGLAFGRYSGDAEDKRLVKGVINQFPRAEWIRTAERANYLLAREGEPARYLR